LDDLLQDRKIQVLYNSTIVEFSGHKNKLLRRHRGI